MPRFPRIAAAVLLALAAPAFAADPAKARKKLDKEGLAFTAEKFLWEVAKEEPKTVALYLEAGMSPDTADDKGVTALHRAAENAEGKVLALLLSAGANPNVAAPNGDTPLCKAADEPAPKNVAALLAAGADPKPACAFGRTALHVAASEGDAETTSALLAAGAPIEARDERQQTPVFFAVRASRPDALKALVAAGADVNAKARNGQTPLHEAVTSDNALSAEILLEAGATVDAKDAQRHTPLSLAAAYDRVKMVPVLLRYGADPAQKGPDGKGLVHLAKESRSPNVVPLLQGAKKVEVAAKPTVPPKGGAPAGGEVTAGKPAASADPKGDLRKMGLAFDAKTFLDRVEAGDAKAAALYAAAGIDASAKDGRGRTALWIAVEKKHVDVLAALLASGVKPDGKNAPPMDYGQTIVAAAVDGGDVEALRALVAAGADAKKGNEYGMTPLHAAAHQGNVEAVKVLLAAGADPNSAPSGAHVLFLPVSEDHVDVVELLLKSGAKAGTYKASLLDSAKSPKMKELLRKAR